MKGRYKNIKEFWKEKILQEQIDFEVPNNRTLTKERLMDELEKLNKWENIENFALEKRKDNLSNAKYTIKLLHPTLVFKYACPLTPDEKEKKQEALIRDIKEEIEPELYKDGNDRNSYKKLFEEFEKGIKKVLGDDIGDWEKRIVEVGYKNKNEELISELQEKEEVVDIKNNWIVNLKKEVSLWKTKYYREKKRVIYYGL